MIPIQSVSHLKPLAFSLFAPTVALVGNAGGLNLKSTGIPLCALVFFAMLGMTPDQLCANNLLNNGSFQTGDFTGWTLVTTANGTAGVGFPIVTMWPLGGSNAAEYEVGQVNYINGDFEGAMLLQVFAASSGTLDLAFDWAATGDGIHNNSDAGLFQLVLDGVVLNSYDVGHIGPNGLFNGTLSGTASVTAGCTSSRSTFCAPLSQGRAPLPLSSSRAPLSAQCPSPPACCCSVVAPSGSLSFSAAS